MSTPGERWGIDFGGVIVQPNDNTDEPPVDINSGRELAQPGAFDAIASLVTRASGQVWIVSKASLQNRQRILAWMRSAGFYQATGFAPDNIRFCRKREEKRCICAELGITHFIDDRADVLASLEGVVAHRILFGSRSEKDPRDPSLIRLENWSGLVRLTSHAPR